MWQGEGNYQWLLTDDIIYIVLAVLLCRVPTAVCILHKEWMYQEEI